MVAFLGSGTPISMATPSSLQSSVTSRDASPKPIPKSPRMEPNVKTVVLGDILIDSWYPSFYPDELVGKVTERLFICKWCFKYSKELLPYLNHAKSCRFEVDGPPGSRVYAKDHISMNEVDGEEHKLYTQNLSLFAKLFLDNKSVFFDVTTFRYYLLICENGEKGAGQVIGFFSKEKMSWDNNNLACILVFPPWQRQGYGQTLMGVSYELSKRDGRIGGPEKPLSEPGRRGYRAYWFGEITRYLVSLPDKKTTTIQDISDATYILPEDITATLKDMDLIERRRKGGASAVINKARAIAWASTNRVSLEPPIDCEAFAEGVRLQQPEEKS